MKATGVGSTYRIEDTNDILEVQHASLGLRVIVGTSPAGSFEAIQVEYWFPARRVIGFRFLDECDLLAFWESGQFNTGHVLFRIDEGGWAASEAPTLGILSIGSEARGRSEWFIATPNGCLNVLATCEPQIRECIT